MAGNTLQAMLIRLGFDLTGLAAGGMEAKAQILAIQQSAQAAQAVVNAGNVGQFGRAAQLASAATAWKQYAAVSASGASTIIAAQERVMASANAMNVSMGGLKTAFGVIGLFALLDFARGSVQAATIFQQQMKLIQTQARATATEVMNMSDSILAMAGSVQTSPEELAKGLYHIESVGRRSAEALNILKIAAEGARVGTADLESTTNAMVAAVTSGIKGVEDMSTAMGTLNGIVGSGNMRMQELATSFRSGILSTGKTFGLTIQDIGMALAAMTDQGIPATEASTRLRIAIAQLGAPTTVAAQQLTRIGLSSRALADDMRGPDGLLTAIRDLQSHLEKSGLDLTEQAALLKAAFGGSRSSTGILIMVNSLSLMGQKLEIIKESSSHFAETFQEQSETAAAKFAELSATVGTLMVHIGNGLLPILTMLAGALTFVAQQTGPLTVIFAILLAAVTRLAVVALARLIMSFGLTTAAMLLGRFATALVTNALAQLSFTGVVATVSVRTLGAAFLTAIGPLNLFAIALAAILIVYNNVKEGIDKQAAILHDHTAEFAKIATLAELEKAYADVTEQARLAAEAESSGFGEMGAKVGVSAVPAIEDTLVQLKTKMDAIKKFGNAAGKDLTGDLAAGISSGQQDVLDETKTLVQIFGGDIQGVVKAAGAAGADAMAQMAKELQAGIDAPVAAMKTLQDSLKAQMSNGAEVIKLEAMLASKDMADGLNSNKAVIRANAETAFKYLIDRLHVLGVDGFETAKTHMDSYEGGVRNLVRAFDPASAAFQEWAANIQAADARTAAFGKTVRGLVQNLQGEIRAGTTTVTEAASQLVDMIGTNLSRLKQVGRAAGTDLMVEIAKGMAAARQAPLTAMENLHKLLKHPMSAMAEEAFLYAALTGKELARGLRSTDPVAHAAAVAAQKIYTDRMDELTNGAFSAGANAGANFSNAFKMAMARGAGSERNIDKLQGVDKLTNVWSVGSIPKKILDAGQKAYLDFLKSLDNATKSTGSSIANTMGKAANAIAAAFDKIQAAAMKYFNKVHAANLQQIEDHRKSVQAIIDSAQAGLDAVGKAQELQDLIRAVNQATDPAAQLAALQALHKFQAQQQIDAAQTALDKQIAAEKAAEDKRFSNQVAAFQKQLNSLERWLDKHPKLWREAQHKIIALLHGFGISYESAGNLLGVSFAKGLKKAILALLKALHILAGGKAPSLAGFGGGAYNLGEDQLAMVHKNEMIIPAAPAGAFRAWMQGAGGGAGGLAGMSGTGRTGGGTIIFQVGDQVLAELSDRRLYVAKSIREPTEIAFGGSVR